ncbi:hypothetical protein ABPG74_003675 [Tetrahymena malaccensis]
MFILCTKREKIRLKPDSLGKDYQKNISKLLYETYLFKAINENEVIVAIKDVTLYDGFVEQVTGEVVFEIQMTYLVQQIVQNEVYEGTIVQQNAKGITVKFGQLQAFIGKHLLQPNSTFFKDKNEWIWQNDEEDSSSVLFYETNAQVKFKIFAINFLAKIDEVNPEGQKQIIGSMNEDGLGLVQWWDF